MKNMMTNISIPLPSVRMSRTLTVLLLSASAVTMVGCGKSIKPEVHEPTKLVKLNQAIDVLQPVFNKSMGKSRRVSKIDPLALQAVMDSQRIIAASRDGKVMAYNRQGQPLWSIDLGNYITSGVALDSESGTAIVSTRDGNVVALDGDTGQILWQHGLSGTVLAPALIEQNRVILSANDGVLHGLSLQTGQPVWQFVTQVPSISVRGSASPVILNSTTALIATADGRVHAIDILSGVPRWSRRIGVPSGASEVERMTDVDGNPVIDGDNLYAISYSGQLYGIDLGSRQVMFIQDAASLKSLALTRNQVIATTLDGHVKAFNRQTGQLLWDNDMLAYRELTNPVTVGNYIAVGDLDGFIHLLSPADGTIVSRVKTSGALSTLQQNSGYLLAQSDTGDVGIWQVIR